MSDSHDEFTFLTHGVDEFHRVLALVVSLAVLTRRPVQSTAETIPLQT